MQNVNGAASPVSKMHVSDKTHYRKAIKPDEITRSTFHSYIGNNICQLCLGKHLLSECPQFVAMSPLERKSILIKHKLC